ncbi:hypothetical protein MKX01_041742 [Papaver californicum]|nr:hypothetical protein MKX01_041742 [Papaver californicum]
MAKKNPHKSLKNPFFIDSYILVFTVICFLTFTSTLAKKSPRSVTETEVKEKKNICYADIESGFWGWNCKSSMIEKENCALKCLSPQCYELVYESDPLEEGEKDYARSQEYKFCMHRISMGESIDGIRGSFDV